MSNCLSIRSTGATTLSVGHDSASWWHNHSIRPAQTGPFMECGSLLPLFAARAPRITLGMGRLTRQRNGRFYSRRHGERSGHLLISFVAHAVDLSLWHDVHGFGILYLSVIAGVMNRNVCA